MAAGFYLLSQLFLVAELVSSEKDSEAKIYPCVNEYSDW